jgi:hypothetical protein
VGLEAYAASLAAEPDLARTLLVDVLGAGPRAVELRRQVLDRFAALFRPAPGATRDSDEALRAIPEAHVRGLVGGISELVQEHIFIHGAASLTELTPSLIAFAHTLLGARDPRGGGSSPAA